MVKPQAARATDPHRIAVMPMRIAHVITRLILGGAQENTVLCCEDLIRRHGDDVLLITGPPLGPEGSLLDRARAGGVPLEIIPALRRPIHPWRDRGQLSADQEVAAPLSARRGSYAQRQGRNARPAPPPGRWACRP